MLNRYYLFKTFLALLLVLVLSGCGSSKQVIAPSPKAMPAWITAPLPSDNEKYIYGMSIESDRESAIKAALSDMVAKLGTSIESSYESYQIVKGRYSKSTIVSQIKSDVSKIKINNYRVLKSHRVSYREFAVMLESDKQKLIKGFKEDLVLKQRSMTEKLNSINKSNILTRYNTKKELSLEASKLLSEILIIAELDNGFDKQKNLNFVSKKNREFQEESKNLKFFVSGDKKSTKFVEVIKNHLAQNSFNVVGSKKNAVEVRVKSSDYINYNDAIDIAVITLDISLLDKRERIGGKSVILKERYNGSMQSVYKNASIHLKQDIEHQGLNELIGLNLK